MKLLDALDLMDEYTTCPRCGNDKIGNGAGTLTVENDSFERTCSCGWKVKVNWPKRGEQV